MNKKILVLVGVVAIVVICIIGVMVKNKKDDSTTNTVQNIEEDKVGAVKESFAEHEWTIEYPLSDIKDFCVQSKLFISSDGDLYKYAFDKLFTNEKNYIKVDTKLKFERFIENNILTEDGDLMYYNTKLTEAFKRFEDYSILYCLPLEEIGKNLDNPYVYFEKNVVRYHLFNSKTNKLEEGIFGQIPINETFINGFGSVLQTDKAFYRNEEIEGKNTLTKIEDISSIYDDIYYYNGSILILNNEMDKMYVTPLANEMLYGIIN